MTTGRVTPTQLIRRQIKAFAHPRDARGGVHLNPRATFVVLAIALAAAPVASTATAGSGAEDPIQPGDPLLGSDGQPFCTLSFAYDSQTNASVYFSTAAHCVSEGDVVSTTDHPDFGTVEFVGDAGTVTEDYVLIRVHADELEHVDGAVLGYPDMPTGVATPDDTMVGDLTPMSGWGVATNQFATTREERTGLLVEHTDDLVRLIGPVTNGDSGGPWLHESGLALGIASQITVTAGTSSEDVETPVGTVSVPVPGAFVGDQGPTVQTLLEDVAGNGYDLTLRTA